MSADEIRKLAGSKVIANCCGKKRGANTPCSVCYENNDGTCEEQEAIHSALLDFAAMVERATAKRGEYNVNYGRVDFEFDTAMVDEIDYILTGKEAE